jgi:ABC-type phosphate transport system permease subunit
MSTISGISTVFSADNATKCTCQKERERKSNFKTKIARSMSNTSFLLIVILVGVIILFATGIVGNMYFEKHDTRTAIIRTMKAVSGREREEEQIRHEWFGAFYYILITIISMIIGGVIVVEVARRLFKQGKQYKCHNCKVEIDEGEAKKDTYVKQDYL